MVLVEAVTIIFKAVAMSQQGDDKMYRKVLVIRYFLYLNKVL